MNFYKIIVSYDGTDYQGWQEQKDVPTVAGTLKKTFINVFKKNISILGASRTDAGVHALGQVALVTTNLTIDNETLISAWNNKLFNDISILSIESVDKSFNPFMHVEQKIYFYHFFIERPLPFNSRYGLYYRWNINFDKLQECLKIFIGTHDFRSFSTGYEMNSTIRTIDDIELVYLAELNVYRIAVKGKSFLHHMIRRIVGACLEVASRPNIEISYLNQVLNEKNPEQILPNADSKGLMLYKIIYKNK